MKIKRILALLLALMMCIATVACNDDTSFDAGTETSEVSDTTANTDANNDDGGDDDVIGDNGERKSLTTERLSIMKTLINMITPPTIRHLPHSVGEK